MDLRFVPLARDAVRDVQVLVYPRSASPRAILNGEAGAGRDLSDLCSRLEQTDTSLSFTLSWHRELDGVSMVEPGQWVLVRLSGVPLCVQRVESLSDYRVMHGVQQVTVQARSRDAAERWHDRSVTTPAYPISAPTASIVLDVCKAMGMQAAEVRVTQLPSFVPRANMRIAGVSAWAALEQVMRPAGLQPYVDALGRLAGYSRDVQREADLVLDDERVEAITGSRSRAPITRLQLRWRAPQMKTVLQAERELASTRMLSGFFRFRQIRRLKFSKDGTQRATNLRFQVKESVNQLLALADERMERTSHDTAAETGAAVVVDMRTFVPALLAFYAVGRIATASIVDYALFTNTVSMGRLVAAGFDAAMLIVFMSMGEGHYAIYGQPFDAVEQVNTTEAYDPTAPVASQRREVIESDFVSSEGAATAYVVREFVYRCRLASAWTVTIVDDPRLEVGDIVQLPGGARVFITGYRRSLSPGAPALLELQGFPA